MATSFQPLGWIDIFDLAASLRTRWGMFNKDEPRLLWLRVWREDKYVFRQEAAKWPELKSLLGRVQKAGNVEFGNIWMELLPSGHLGRFGVEEGKYSRTWLALRWNPQAFLFSGPEAWCLQPGWITLVNHRAPCSAINMGETNAVALVVDSRKKEPSAAA